MDEKAHEALQVKKYADITFTQTGTATAQLSGTKFSTTVTGTLTISGKKQKVNLRITGDTANGQLKVSGTANLKMTDFGIDPPKAMLGAVKSGDAIKVNYEVVLK
ncbi:YceI family protein [Geofilum rhodophaeum]|uniref:YceI family protein n=1 Tax=Geofilum rhodophaeum TaxID=1965019 RepID=UPI000B527421|nr:YceI family protein [Geofilum rhodophaeum]